MYGGLEKALVPDGEKTSVEKVFSVPRRFLSFKDSKYLLIRPLDMNVAFSIFNRTRNISIINLSPS